MGMASGERSTELSGKSDEWDNVQIEVDRIIAESDASFDPSTVANVSDLLIVCRSAVPVPMSLGKGYWSTVRFSWPKFEIEVFEDRLEVYHFYDQHTDIWYEQHKPGEVFSSRFLAELAALSPQLGA
jgi:hypothetical protein